MGSPKPRAGASVELAVQIRAVGVNAQGKGVMELGFELRSEGAGDMTANAPCDPGMAPGCKEDSYKACYRSIGDF